ncbi:MAG: helix-turn-helix domain-containing protein [Oscillospiraceae bacterium]|nr:helix-turn-helix domain-containing protein [Oscillospiraceae bacterium]
MTYSDVITKRILGLCAENSITVNRLATLSGLRQSTLENIVKGNTKHPGLRTLHRLAQGFGITLSQFLDFHEMNEIDFDDD